MTPLRCRMIEDMTLGGFGGPQPSDLHQVGSQAGGPLPALAGSTERGGGALLSGRLRDRGVARGTFKVAHYAIQFLYRQRSARDWPLFSKKRFVCQSRSGCPMRWPTIRSAVCSVA